MANALSIEYEAPLSKFRSEMLTLIKRKGKLFTDTICNELNHEYLPLRKIVIDDHSLAAGAYYARFYASYFNFLEMLSSHDYKEINVINNIVSHSKGAVRDAILCSFLDQMGYNEQNKTIYDIAYDYLSDPYYIKEFNHIKSKCSINTNKYELVDTEGKQIKLSKFNGKLLLIDIWHTGCGGCTQYYKNIITKLEEEYKNDSRLQIISISTDKNEQTWKNSINKNIYTHPGALNVYTGGKGSFHPFFTELGIRAAPTPILIDQNGNTIDFDSYRLWDLGLIRKQIQERKK
jgi:thiol-disulfide isomerase/thioredoxin